MKMNENLFDKDVKMAMYEEDGTTTLTTVIDPDTRRKDEVEDIPYTVIEGGEKLFNIDKQIIRAFEQYGEEYGTITEYEQAILDMMRHGTEYTVRKDGEAPS